MFCFSGASSTSSRRSGTGASGSGRSTADYYQLDKSSPYHHGAGGRSGGTSDRSGGRNGPPPAAPPQDYGMLLRQQEYEHRMAHHSGKAHPVKRNFRYVVKLKFCRFCKSWPQTRSSSYMETSVPVTFCRF